MSPEELDEYLLEHGDECEEHGPDCDDEDCLTIEQEHIAAAIESEVEMGSITEAAAIERHIENGTWEPAPAE
jgi:hypothetical protein